MQNENDQFIFNIHLVLIINYYFLFIIMIKNGNIKKKKFKKMFYYKLICFILDTQHWQKW